MLLLLIPLFLLVLLVVRWRTAWDWRRSTGYSVRMAWLVIRLLIGVFLIAAIAYGLLTAVIERI